MMPVTIKYYHTLNAYDNLPVNSSTDTIISVNCFEERDSLTSTCKRLMSAVDDSAVKLLSVVKETGKLADSSTGSDGYLKIDTN